MNRSPNLTASSLRGCITALATPFDASGQIDFPAYFRLLDQQIEAQVSAVVVAGSTGEASSLSDGEYEQLLRATVDYVKNRIGVIAGTGLSNTAKTIALTRQAKLCGAQATLVVTPPYVRPTQAGLLAHYGALADAGDLPVILYNVPARTGCDLLPQTVAQLIDHPQIIGLKEAVADPQRWQALQILPRNGFSLLSGDDGTFVQAVIDGADGVISVASNLVPYAFVELSALIARGDLAAARKLDSQLASLYTFLGCEPNPIPLKAVLSKCGIGHGLRLPLLELSQAQCSQVDGIIDLIDTVQLPLVGRVLLAEAQ